MTYLTSAMSVDAAVIAGAEWEEGQPGQPGQGLHALHAGARVSAFAPTHKVS